MSSILLQYEAARINSPLQTSLLFKIHLNNGCFCWIKRVINCSQNREEKNINTNIVQKSKNSHYFLFVSGNSRTCNWSLWNSGKKKTQDKQEEERNLCFTVIHIISVTCSYWASSSMTTAPFKSTSMALRMIGFIT